MSDNKNFYAYPNNITLSLLGKSDNLLHNYVYKFNDSNNTWTEVGMLTQNSDIPVPKNGPGYIETKYNYTIENGTITSSIEECQNDTDFPMYDIDFDMFFVGFFDNNSSGDDEYVRYTKFRCGQIAIDVSHPDIYITNNKVSLYTYACPPCLVFAGEIGSYGKTDGCGLTETKTMDENFNNVFHPMVVNNITYSRPYKIHPYIVGTSLSDYYHTTSNECMADNIALSCNIYINWDKYYLTLLNLFKNTSNNLASKYNVTVNNNDTFDIKNINNNSIYLNELLGFNDYPGNNPLEYTILYNVQVRNNSGDLICTFTNLYSPETSGALNNWVSDCENTPNDNYTYRNGDELLRCNFDKVIELFSGHYNNGIFTSSRGNEKVYLALNVPGQYYDDENRPYTYLKDYFSDQMTSWINLYNNQGINPGTWKPICYLSQIARAQISKQSSSTLPQGVCNLFEIDGKFSVIQQQRNGDGDENIKYTIATFNKKLVLKSKSINYNNALRNQILNNGIQSETSHTYTINDTTIYSIDWPILFTNINGSGVTVYSSSGIFGTFEETPNDKFSSGIVYNLACSCSDLNNLNTEIVDKDVTYTYYNYALNKKATCNNSGGTLQWVDDV